MKRSKTELRFFTIPEYEKEQEYLERMHQSGWCLQHVQFPGLYHFTACEPEDVVYQLDYNQEGITHKAEYVQLFLDAGWEYLFDFVGYSYFRKPVKAMHERESIFCDIPSRLDMMDRVFKARMIPMLFLFFLVLIPQLFMQSVSPYLPLRLAFFCFYASLLVFYLILFIRFGLQYWRLRKQSE